MRFSRSSGKNAFTLIEVVVGLTLMASVLVGSLLAFSAHHRQQATAEGKLAAVAIADQLLNEWTGTREGVPASGQGAIFGRPNWYWSTSVVAAVMPAKVPMRVIRLEIIEWRVDASPRALASVEVVEALE